jgi:hypothetical protein
MRRPASALVFRRLSIGSSLDASPRSEERWQSARDILFQLRALAEPDAVGRGAGTPPDDGLGDGCGCGRAALVGSATLRRGQRPPPPCCRFLPPSRLEPPEAVSSLAVTRDGSQIAFISTYEGRNHLWVRPLRSARRDRPGHRDARIPFWSPDGKSIDSSFRRLPHRSAEGRLADLCGRRRHRTAGDLTTSCSRISDAAQQRSDGIYAAARGGDVTNHRDRPGKGRASTTGRASSPTAHFTW